MSVEIKAPFPVFTDIDGDPLENGYIYIGDAGLNPQANPKQAYFDAALTVPAAQPIRTKGGYPVQAGSPAQIYVLDDYSITVRNKNGTLIFTRLSNFDGASGGEVNLAFFNYSLEAARTAASLAGKTVVVDASLTAAQSNLSGTWPSDRTLKIVRGGTLNNSAPITIAGAIEAGLYQIFNGSDVAFDIEGQLELFPEWWGAKGDGATDDTVAIQAALDAVPTQGASHVEADRIGAVVVLSNRKYRVTTTLRIGYDGTTLEGRGSTLYIDNGGATAAIGLLVDSYDLVWIYSTTIRDVRFVHSELARAAGTMAVKFVYSEGHSVERCTFNLATMYGCFEEYCIVGRYINNIFSSAVAEVYGMMHGIYSYGVSNATVVRDNTFTWIHTSGLSLLGSPTGPMLECAGNVVQGNRFEHMARDCIQILRNRAITIQGNWMENAGKEGLAGNGYIMDLATTKNEAGNDSGFNASITIVGNVFASSDSANADFHAIKLAYAATCRIQGNYCAGIDTPAVGQNWEFGASVYGLEICYNWCYTLIPVLVGTMPPTAVIRENFVGVNGTRWGNQFTNTVDVNVKPQVYTTGGTPSLTLDGKRLQVLVLNYTNPENITNFTNGAEGQELVLVAANGNATIKNTSGDNGINLVGGIDFTMTAKDTLVLRLINSGGYNNRWFEISRSAI